MVDVVHGVFVLKQVVFVLLLLLQFEVFATRRNPTILVVQQARERHAVCVVVAAGANRLRVRLGQAVVAARNFVVFLEQRHFDV